ncbi:MAG: hypothetical protein R3Y43_07385 [Alphaproteobacteria bacterium]
MGIYLLISLFVVYFVSYFVLGKIKHKKVWTLLFGASFVLMGLCLLLLKSVRSGGISIWGLDEYYLLYLMSSLVFLLGVINLWLYKKELFLLLRTKEE